MDIRYMSSLILSYLCLAHSLLAQNYTPPEYKFLDKFERADLNYQAIDTINFIGKGITMLDSVFNVVKGKYTVYRFMSYDRGLIFDEYISNINELIILKADKHSKIVDGYSYMLQNPEMPSTCHLYRLSKKMPLIRQIKIADLKFKIVHKNIKGYEVCIDAPVFLQDNRYLSIESR